VWSFTVRRHGGDAVRRRDPVDTGSIRAVSLYVTGFV
jgi:hypothetical protein